MSPRWPLVVLAGCGFQLDAGLGPAEDAPGLDVAFDGDPDARVMPASCAQLALGSDHTCALRRSDSNVYCWGSNAFGELGGSSATVPVSLGIATSDLSSRTYTTCAVATDGTVRCWGVNDAGQIGDNTIGGTRAPSLVVGMSGAVQVAASRSHVCARRADGSMRCWGNNSSGQLGDGTTLSKLAAITDVSGLTGVARVTTGGTTCAHTTAGMGWCWGDNTHGQLGDGTTTRALVPLAMPVMNVRRTGPASFFVSPDSGAHTCAIVGSGEVWCWGDNAFGQLGNGTTNDSPTPVLAAGISDAIEITMGRWHVCALRGSGRVSCWGRNLYGEVGNGTAQVASSPVDVGLTNVIAVGAGGFHSCAITETNQLSCWGLNTSGHLGDGTTVQRNAPVSSVAICP